jgi:NADH:ubiquinone oxidoreductase subunit 6 (subunit J)
VIAAGALITAPNAQEIVFCLLGAVMIAAAVLVVTPRQLVHAALWLVACFGASADLDSGNRAAAVVVALATAAVLVTVVVRGFRGWVLSTRSCSPRSCSPSGSTARPGW